MTPIIFDQPDEGRAVLARKGQYVVLRVSGSSRYVSRDYAPSHFLSEQDPEIRAADVVFNWVRSEKPVGEELEIAGQYLSQWPDGPQIGPFEAALVSDRSEPVALTPQVVEFVNAESKPLEQLTPIRLFEAINQMVWELGDHETDSDRALALRQRIHTALSLLRAAWKKNLK